MRNPGKKHIVIGVLTLMSFSASAQSLQEFRAMSPEDKRAYMQSMSEQERDAMRQKWRAEFDALSDEEKAAIRAERDAKRKQRKERAASMTDEERAAMRQKKEQRKLERQQRQEQQDAANSEADSQ